MEAHVRLMSLSTIPGRSPMRGAGLRVVAALTAFMFLNLEFAALSQGQVALQSAQAQGKTRRVAVFVLPATSSAAGDAQVLQTLLRQEVSRLVGVKLLTGTPDPEVNLGAEVAPQVEDGFRALNSKEGSKAETAFTAAYERLIRHTGKLDKRLMARTLKGLGVARVMTGQRRAGQQMMRASLNLWPDQYPPEYGYTLDVLNAFKEVQLEQSEQPSGAAAVLTDPAGASVSIGGEVSGYAPRDAQDLQPGLNWIEAELDGYVRAGAFVEVKSGEKVPQRFSLQPRANLSAYNKILGGLARARGSKADEMLVGLQALLKADEILALTIATKGSAYKFGGWHHTAAGSKDIDETITRDANFLQGLTTLVTLALNTQPAPAVEEVPLDGPPNASLVAGATDDDLVIDPNDPILKSKDDLASKPIYAEWWFWTIIGGVAAVGLGVGLVVGLSSGSESKGPVGDVQIGLHRVP